MGGLVTPTWQGRRCVLSRLQKQVAALLRDLPEASDFALAGGAALILHGETERLTQDLDYFAVDPGAVDRLVPAFVAAARARGLNVITERVAAGFARLMVTDGDDRTGVDLAADARLLPPEQSELGLVLSARELAVDKVLAVFGRAEARDFVDLARLESRFGLERLFALAARKDTGFDRSMFVVMLERLDRLARDEFDVDDEAFEFTVATVKRWRGTLGSEP